MTFKVPFHPSPSFLVFFFASSMLPHTYAPLFHIIPTIPLSTVYRTLLLQLPMENHSKVNVWVLCVCFSCCVTTVFGNCEADTMDQAMKDQQREGYCKAAADDYKNPSNRASDYILPHLLNLYASRATGQDFEIYAPNATFEDPLMRAHGVKQIKSAFYSLSKLFSESRIVEYTITENEISPGNKEILIDNKQYYKLMGKDIHMISLIKLYTEGGKVVRHEDCWDKKPLRNRETVGLPLVGRMMEASRRASMLLTHALMGFGKDPTM